jgi:hypothetical protein
VSFAVGFLFQKLAETKEKEKSDLDPVVAEANQKSQEFSQAILQRDQVQGKVDQITTWMEERYYWGDVLTELKGVLVRSEDDIKKKLSAQKPNVEAGIWIEQMTTFGNSPSPTTVSADNTTQSSGGAPGPASTIALVCRAVNLSGVDPSANSETAFEVEAGLKADPLFDPKTTQLSGQIMPDDSNGTFTFGLTAVLQNPIKF